MKILNFKFKILIPLLFALAVALGIIQSTTDNPFAFKKQNNYMTASNDSLRGYYEKSLQLSTQSQNKNEVSFLAVGDILLSRNVASKIKKAGDPLLPFSAMTDVFNKVDFSFGNLESPIDPSLFPSPSVGEGGPPLADRERLRINDVPTGSLIFKAAPIVLRSLAKNKFKVVSLANNHALDQGIDGLEQTINFLDENGIQSAGAGMNIEDAWESAVIDAKGIKMCFLAASYSSINDGGKSTNNYVARIEDLKNLKSSILNLKSNCDFIAISMHAGTEYVQEPNQSQINFARAAIDAGADMVIGHHPHWVQTIEKYKGKYIFYSLGNFIFDQMWSQETKEGLALKIAISKSAACSAPIYGQNTSADKSARYNYNCPRLQGFRTPATLDSIELIPIIIENYSTPRLANKLETKTILEKINIKNTTLK